MNIFEAPRIGRFIRWAFTGFNLKRYESIMNDNYAYSSKRLRKIIFFFDFLIGIVFSIFIAFGIFKLSQILF
jgi:hypothetical protein